MRFFPSFHPRRARQSVLLAAAALLVALAGCEHTSGAFGHHDFTAEGWPAGDTLSFPVDSVTVPGSYRLTVCIRSTVTPSYPFQQLVLEVVQDWQSPLPRRADTLSFHMSAPDGERYAPGVSLFSTADTLSVPYLPAGSRGTLRLRHLMRRTPLPGLHDVSVLLERIS